ncbi:hypothetical protein PTKIN_Ptkin07bG0036700 [Pterospermum kingtungense]
MGLASYMWSAMPFMGMVTVECTDIGVSVISKAAMSKGMSNIVSVVYYNALASFILLPYILFCRNNQAPITFSLLCKLFLLGFMGSSGQIMYLTGIKYSSPTLTAAMMNLIPIFTFPLAVVFRMEKLQLRSASSQAKVFGAVVSVTGAVVATLYKGPPIIITSSFSNIAQQLLLSRQSQWICGGLLIAWVCLSSAASSIFQAAIVKQYPEKMTIVFFHAFFIAIQSAIFSVILERNPSAWELKSTVEVAAIVCSAIFSSLFRIGVHTWCLYQKGPVYVAMFKPLGIVIAVFLTVMFLGETLYLGSVIGSVIIAVGFYAVMWGKTKERNMVMVLEDHEVSSPELYGQRSPLLQSNDIV